MSYRAMWLHVLCHMTSMRRRYGNNKAIRFKWWSPKKLMLGAQLEYFKLMWQGLMAVCWVILRGQYIYTVIQAVLSLLYIEAKCRFFSVVTWKDIIKYLQNCEGCTRFCEILCIYIYIDICTRYVSGVHLCPCRTSRHGWKNITYSSTW